uniref:Zinc finger, CCHC-type n=1 Tax=Tanacetum cinerariifolium TaxID=118510 RepID=A0A6L2N9Y1_TANCI|nr:zinc finger, CCHC-type [Tanacetum cinerariifolium]
MLWMPVQGFPAFTTMKVVVRGGYRMALDDHGKDEGILGHSSRGGAKERADRELLQAPSCSNQIDLTKEFLSSWFALRDIGEADVILVSTPMDACEKLMPNNDQVVSQLEYSRVIGCLIFLLGGGVIYWASKKQTCITGSTIESEFVALAAAGKEAEWLTNLLFEIPLWVKPITPISIHCDSAATLAKAYSQMYNEKSRHLGVSHNMIHELITNERTKAHVLQIILKVCLEPADKEDEVANFSMANFFEKTNVEEDSDIEPISETFFGDQADDLNEVVDSAQQSIPKETSYDPFNIYDILNKENKDVNAAVTNSSIPFPPGFTPDKPDTDVGQTMAFSMEGSIKDMERINQLGLAQLATKIP